MVGLMKSHFDPARHHRRSIRLKSHDYGSVGAYFVTIVTQGRECLFGEIIDGEIHLTKQGEIVRKWCREIPRHFPNVEIGALAIMPNHVHAIIFKIDERAGEVISTFSDPNQNSILIEQHRTENQDDKGLPLRKPRLGQIIAYLKYQSTKEINLLDDTKAIRKLWQRNYYEHIIRSEKELEQKTFYILDNPSRWVDDLENPTSKKSLA